MSNPSTKLFLAVFLIITPAISYAEVNPQSIIQIFQRLELLEKKTRELHGQNEVLKHQISQLKKVQKQGFLNVDERIDELATSMKKEAKGEDVNTKETTETLKPKDKKNEIEEKETEEKKDDGSTQKVIQEQVEKAKKTDTDSKQKPKQTESTSKTARAPSAYEKETYQAAFNKMNASPTAATKAFEEYIKMQPQSPLAANAQYWIGEIKYSHNNYKGAVQDFIKVLQKYKTSNKAPDAAIKLGYSFYALKNWAYARRTFEDVLKYFPENKNAVNLATKRLELMKAAGH